MSLYKLSQKTINPEQKPWGFKALLWNPSAIETALWLDAADSSTITESGGAVSAWADKSGNGRDAIQTQSGTYPSISADAVIFNGSTYLYNAEEGVYNDWDSDDGLNTFASGNKSSINLTINSSSSHTYWTPNGIGVNSGIQRSGTGVIPFGLYGSSFSGLLSPAYVNGSLLDTRTAIKNFKSASFGGFSVGCRIGLGESKGTFPSKYNQGIIGTIREIILTAAACSDAERQTTEGYLAHKWCLTDNLPAEHPYKHVAPRV